jgi:hypothetical protein
MKLLNIVTSSSTEGQQRLVDLGKSMTSAHSRDRMDIHEATRTKSEPRVRAEMADDDMIEAIHVLTQDQKHLHMKLAHHD